MGKDPLLRKLSEQYGYRFIWQCFLDERLGTIALRLLRIALLFFDKTQEQWMRGFGHAAMIESL